MNVDSIHKLGRQILCLAQLAFYGWALNKGIELTPEVVAAVSGVSASYILAKGKGNEPK